MDEIIDFLSSRKTQHFSNEDFKRILPAQGNLLFIDGGNAELIASPDFSINFIRIGGALFEGKNKIRSETAEFYVIIHTIREKDKILVKSRIKKIKGDLDIDEKELLFHYSETNLNFFSGQIRRICEIKFASHLVKKTDNISCVILDGCLETKTDLELRAMEELKNTSKEKRIDLCAVSKTTSMINQFGESVPFLLNTHINNSGLDRWYFKLAETNIKTFFVKLHPLSNYVFRCDTLPETGAEIFSYLTFVSNDAVFLGYPYGLIEADRIARVSNREKEMLRLEIAAKSGKRWNHLEQREKALDAHRILDNIGY